MPFKEVGPEQLADNAVCIQDIDPDRFLDSKIRDMYPGKDFHRVYAGEIAKCLVKE